MKNSRIVVFADGEVGLQIVRIMLKHDPDFVCGLITLPGNESCQQLAQGHSVRCIEFDRARSHKTAEQVRSLNGNIFILAWWPLILKSEFLKLGQDVTLNLHPSLLPYARGKDPNFWSIVEQSPFGVSIHHVTSDIDAGDVAFQREIAYSWEDTGETLYRKAITAIVELFRESYPRIVTFDIPKKPQLLADGSFHRRRDLDERCLIDLDQHYTAREILNLLRARTFEPHPGCRFVDGTETYEVRVSIRCKDKWGCQVGSLDEGSA
jgi:methionyl-tRNA formyltransferase